MPLEVTQPDFHNDILHGKCRADGLGKPAFDHLVVDMRSDEVTLPSQEMRNYIANAKLGNDAMGEDPTVTGTC